MDLKYYKRHYCSDIENVENFEKALADNFVGWECHHRLETHTPDGKRRDVDVSHKELKALGMYYHRPASELVFLITREHNAYRKGKLKSEETRRKMSKPKSEETRRRMSESAKGKKMSTEARRKMSEVHKGKPKSEETRRRMSEAKKCARWYNNGKINVRVKECPEGFVPGRY